MKKEKIIPVVMIQENNNFRLSNPKKGKLLNNKIYTAYNKSKLSSIPKNNEIILFEKTIEEMDYLQKIQTQILKDNNNNSQIKTNNKINENNSLMKNINNKTNETLKNTFSKLNSDLFNKEQLIKNNNYKSTRLNNYSEFMNKYFPGPGQYSLNNLSLKNNNSLRYQSLFKEKTNNKNLNKNNYPGPGSYNISSILYKNSQIPYLDLKEERFKKDKKEKIGPGYYFRNEEEKKNPKKSKSTNLLLSHEKEEFLKNKVKLFNLIKKYFGKENKEEIPGPGKYNFQSVFSKYKKESNNFKKKKLNSKSYIFGFNGNKSNLISDNIRRKYNNAILNEKKHFSKSQNLNDNDKLTFFDYKGIRSPFISKTKKLFSYFNNHVPGPCYYN